MFRLQLQAAQTSMLSFEKLHPDTTTNHHVVAVQITGELNISFFKQALQAVIERHEVLKSRLYQEKSENFLVSYDNNPTENNLLTHSFKLIEANTLEENIPVEQLDETLRKLKEEKFLTDPFNLNQGPLWRAILIKLSPQLYQFSIAFHHIMIDAQSVGIIFKDLSHYYNSLLNNTPPTLPSLSSLSQLTFKLADNEFHQRLNYWKKTLENLNNVALHTDYLPEKKFNFTIKSENLK